MKNRIFKSLLISLLLLGSLSVVAKSRDSDNTRTENRGSVFGSPSVFLVWYGDLSGSNPATSVIGELVASLGGSSYLLLKQNWGNDRRERCASSSSERCAPTQGEPR